MLGHIHAFLTLMMIVKKNMTDFFLFKYFT